MRSDEADETRSALFDPGYKRIPKPGSKPQPPQSRGLIGQIVRDIRRRLGQL